MRLATRTGAIATLSVVVMGLGTPLALAHGGGGGSGSGSYGASYDRSDGRGDVRAASYINPDTGAAAENPDVNRNSSCTNPDQRDEQRLCDPDGAGPEYAALSDTNRDGRNDLCFQSSY